MASLTDLLLIEKARREAQAVLENDPDLQLPEHQMLRTFLDRSWGNGKADIS
jgi:hypothetical protein